MHIPAEFDGSPKRNRFNAHWDLENWNLFALYFTI